MKPAFISAICLGLLISLSCSAQPNDTLAVPSKELKHLSFQKGKSRLTLSGNYRLRFELQNQYNAKKYATGTTETFLLSRLRLNLEYQYSRWLRLFLEFQDARIAGSTLKDEDYAGKNNPFHDPFDINKLYVSVKPFDSLEIITGRQAFNLANRRLFGPGNWGNTGRYIWDAVSVKYSHRLFTTQVLYGYNIMHQPDVFPNVNKEGPHAFAIFNTIRKLPVNLDIFYVYKFDETSPYTNESGYTGHLYAHYFGGRFIKTLQRFEFLFMGIYQSGSWAGDPLTGAGIFARAGYTFKSPESLKLLIFYIFGTGDRDPADHVRQTFDGVFSGADTDLYSWMNFSFWKNVHQIRGDILVPVWKTISLRGEYHTYFLAQPADAWYLPGRPLRQDVSGSSGNWIGQEIDLTFKAEFLQRFRILAGYCVFLPGEFVANTGEDPVASWAFGQLTVLF